VVTDHGVEEDTLNAMKKIR